LAANSLSSVLYHNARRILNLKDPVVKKAAAE